MPKMRPLHAARIERFLGAEKLAALQGHMRGWYADPISIAVPGNNNVEVTKDGDFRGRLTDGFFASMQDRFDDVADGLKPSNISRRLDRWSARQALTMNAGFTGIVDLIQENLYAGKQQHFPLAFSGSAGATGRCTTMWQEGNFPVAGATPSAAPGGNAVSSATTGALNLNYNTPISGDNEFFLRADVSSSAATFGLLLYDRLFHVAKTMASITAETVTGVPTRYTSTTVTAADYVQGNFVFIEVLGVLSATAHNWTGLYTNQAGTTGQTLPSITGVSAAAVPTLDQPSGQWFCPLSTSDSGVKALTSMTCSASVTGTVSFAIGHPIAWIPLPMASGKSRSGGVHYQINLAQIFSGACLNFLEPPKSGATGVFYQGSITTVRG